jgi:Flp pilus assembly protein TadD
MQIPCPRAYAQGALRPDRFYATIRASLAWAPWQEEEPRDWTWNLHKLGCVVRMGVNLWRASLKLTPLALAVLLLGLVPYPQGFTTAMRQAEAFRAAREYSAAEEAYRQAAHLSTESSLPWLRLGTLLQHQHRFMPGTLAFFEAERLGAGMEAMYGLGESYAGQRDWAAAIGSWLRALALEPDDARIFVGLGRANIAQGQFAQAEGYLRKALELEPAGPQAATAHSLMGRLLMGDEPGLAADHFRQAGDEDMLAVLEAVNVEPAAHRRLLLLGIAALQRNELTLARWHFERAADLVPDDAEILAYLAHTLDQLGETVAARGLLDQALSLDGDSVLVYYFLGTHQRLVGNVKDAQATLWQALLRDPENAALRVEMAEAFVDQGDYPTAEEWYRGALEVASEEVDFHLILTHFYLDHLYRVAEGGVPAAQALVSMAPGDARAHDLLGWAYHLAGQQGEAEMALLQALSLDPTLPSAHFHLGNVYLLTGQRELARRHLQRAADWDTDGFYRERAQLLLNELD